MRYTILSLLYFSAPYQVAMSLLNDNLITYLSRWVRKKELQIFTRSHLSHVLALALVLLVLARELPDLAEVVPHPSKATLWHALIVVITAGTLLTAVWEFAGNKLGTTPQEIRFVLGVRSLLTQLEKFKREIEGAPFTERFNKFHNFSSLFLIITSNALCGKKDIAGGLMIYQKGHETLALHTCTPGSMYQPGLEIPLTTIKKDQRGPAARAFESGLIAYMPKKSKAIGVLLEPGQGESYSLVNMFRGWYPCQSEAEEKFGSVLSVPVSIYQTAGNKVSYGILNYTTVKGDLFVHRDYIMAECFASILAQAIYSMLSTESVHVPPSPVPAAGNNPTRGQAGQKVPNQHKAKYKQFSGKKKRKRRKR